MSEEVAWFLKIENVDLQRRNLSFGDSIVITDIFDRNLTLDGFVANLAPDDTVDQGIVSNHPMYIKNIELVEIALSLN